MMWRDEKPSLSDVAFSIREELLGKSFLIPDKSRDDTEDTHVHLLRSYGFEIVGIEPAE